MKTKNNEELILKYLEKHPNVSAEKVSENTGIFKLNVFKILKGMVNDKVLIVNTNEKPSLYSLNAIQKSNGSKITHDESKSPKPMQVTKVDKKADQERQNKAQEEPLIYKKGPRDTSKLEFQNKLYGKGPLVLAIVSDYVSKNPRLSLTKLKEIFPDSLQPRYGFCVETPRARRLTIGPKERYFWKAPLNVAGKKLVISSQWGAGPAFESFLRMAQELGYKIKRV